MKDEPKYYKFADLYLLRCKEESNEINERVYSKLVKLDFKLGTTPSTQLFSCLCITIRSDIIKVQVFDLTNLL